jgi:hypothetical protein
MDDAYNSLFFATRPVHEYIVAGYFATGGRQYRN